MNKGTVRKGPAQSLVVAAFAAIYIIWGSTYLGILFAIKTIPPLLMAGTRFTVAGLLLLLWCRIKGESLPAWNSVGKIALSGLLMLFLGNGAVTWVEQYIPTGLAAIIVATVPLWFVLLDKRQWKFYFSNKGIILGLLIGFAGVVLLFAGKSSADLVNDKMKLISLFVLVAGTVGWAVGSLYTKYEKTEGSTFMKVAIQMLAGGVALFMAGFALQEQKDFVISRVTWTSIGALLYLIVFGSLIGYMAYMWLLGIKPASLVGTYAYVNPVVAVFLGWLFAGEAISTQQGIGLAVVIAGLLLVHFAKEKKAEAPVKSAEAKRSVTADKQNVHHEKIVRSTSKT